MIVPTLTCACWSGYELVTMLAQNRWSFLLRFFSGIPLGLLYQSLFVLILQCYIPWGFNQALIVIFFFSFFSIIIHLFNQKFVHPSLKIRMMIFDIIGLFIAMIFFIYRLRLIYYDEGRYTRGAAYSDFSFHTELVSSFSIGCNMNRSSLLLFQTPMAANTTLSYPVLVNFYSAFLYASCNATFPIALRWPALLIGVSFIFLIYSLTLKFTSNSLAALISIPLWAFSGGLGFLEVFDFGIEPVNGRVNYIHDFHNDQKAFWFQSLTHIFHPQRCATFALPLCYITILSLITGIEKFDWHFFLLAALVVGITPQTQAHAYVSLAVFSISLAITTFPLPKSFKYNDIFSKKSFQAGFCWALFGIVANLIAFPLCLPYFDRTETNKEFLTFKPIWKNKLYTHPPFAFFRLWWKSLGPFAIISLFTCYATASLHQIRIYMASLVVFFVASTIMFQPWELDNCKVFQDGWMPLAIGMVAQFFTTIMLKTRSFFIVFSIGILFVSCLGSGVLNMATYEGYRGQLYSIADESAGKWIAENTPITSIFYQSKDEVMAPSASYAGRSLLFGYVGWMSSHGLMNFSILGNLDQIAKGEKHDMIEAYNLKYLMKNLNAGDRNLNQQVIQDIDGKPQFEKVMEFDQYHLFKYIAHYTDLNSEKTQHQHTKTRKKQRPIYNFTFDD